MDGWLGGDAVRWRRDPKKACELVQREIRIVSLVHMRRTFRR